eukprot:gene30478-37698_t
MYHLCQKSPAPHIELPQPVAHHSVQPVQVHQSNNTANNQQRIMPKLRSRREHGNDSLGHSENSGDAVPVATQSTKVEQKQAKPQKQSAQNEVKQQLSRQTDLEQQYNQQAQQNSRTVSKSRHSPAITASLHELSTKCLSATIKSLHTMSNKQNNGDKKNSGDGEVQYSGQLLIGVIKSIRNNGQCLDLAEFDNKQLYEEVIHIMSSDPRLHVTMPTGQSSSGLDYNNSFNHAHNSDHWAVLTLTAEGQNTTSKALNQAKIAVKTEVRREVYEREREEAIVRQNQQQQIDSSAYHSAITQIASTFISKAHNLLAKGHSPLLVSSVTSQMRDETRFKLPSVLRADGLSREQVIYDVIVAMRSTPSDSTSSPLYLVEDKANKGVMYFGTEEMAYTSSN